MTRGVDFSIASRACLIYYQESILLSAELVPGKSMTSEWDVSHTEGSLSMVCRYVMRIFRIRVNIACISWECIFWPDFLEYMKPCDSGQSHPHWAYWYRHDTHLPKVTHHQSTTTISLTTCNSLTKRKWTKYSEKRSVRAPSSLSLLFLRRPDSVSSLYLYQTCWLELKGDFPL